MSLNTIAAENSNTKKGNFFASLFSSKEKKRYNEIDEEIKNLNVKSKNRY